MNYRRLYSTTTPGQPYYRPATANTYKPEPFGCFPSLLLPHTPPATRRTLLHPSRLPKAQALSLIRLFSDIPSRTHGTSQRVATVFQLYYRLHHCSVHGQQGANHRHFSPNHHQGRCSDSSLGAGSSAHSRGGCVLSCILARTVQHLSPLLKTLH